MIYSEALDAMLKREIVYGIIEGKNIIRGTVVGVTMWEDSVLKNPDKEDDNETIVNNVTMVTVRTDSGDVRINGENLFLTTDELKLSIANIAISETEIIKNYLSKNEVDITITTSISETIKEKLSGGVISAVGK
jgi:hypothetical protein